MPEILIINFAKGRRCEPKPARAHSWVCGGC